ncbi:hypothetical protein R50073_19450 [Maricurvus nonylphenolicus]|uniref:TetR/AcrR family transcriptional regulator n=1 Tax=Maricurvus nonylphenolicus TaxID=1008307 RepID=UPI0036F35405
MQKARTQAERTAASDNAMFKAAIKLLAQHSPKDVTLAQIGREAGFSGGLISYRFGSKAGLLEAVSERILELWEKQVFSSIEESSSPLDAARHVTSMYLHNVGIKSDLMLAQYRLMNESYSTCREILPYFKAFDLRIRKIIVNAIEKAKVSGTVNADVDSEAFAVTYVGMLRGVAVQYFINKEIVNLDSAEIMIDRYCESILSL